MKYKVQFITAHPTSEASIVSLLISYFSEKSKERRISGDFYFWFLREASHIICRKTDGELIEADWGDSFLLFWRKNGGVRKVTESQLEKRKPIHILWEIECTEDQQYAFDTFLESALYLRLKYDFLGLLNAAKVVLFSCFGKRAKRNFNEKQKVFCSELLFEALKFSGIYKGNKDPSEISPALCAEESGARCAGYFFPTEK